MAVQVSYPGVYIEEFAPGAPIQGVGTAVAAFLGQNTYGPPMKPTLFTSWDAYLRMFAPPLPIEPEDDDFLYYAVRGFFANGGQTCFVTAISNATPDFVDLVEEANPLKKIIRLTARRSGPQSPAIGVVVAAAHSVDDVMLFKPEVDASATAGSRSVNVGTAANAAQFLPGDDVVIGNTTGTPITSEPATVARTSGTIVYLQNPLQATYANVKLRLASLPAFAATFRVVDRTPPSQTSAAKLVVGSIITVTQGTGAGAPAPKTTVVTAVRAERISSSLTTYRVTVRDGLTGFTLYGTQPIQLQSQEFDLTVGQPVPTPAPPPTYPGLSMETLHPRYYANVINSDAAGLLLAHPLDPPTGPPSAATVTLGGAQSHDATAIKSRSSDYERALALLEPIRDINIVVAADRTDLAVQKAVLDHCSRLHDRFAIFDAGKATAVQDIEVQREGLENDKGFGALYYPWIEVTSAKTGRRTLVPPGGYVAGIYARTDLNRGVFKAPAGNECVVNGALGVETMLSDTDQGFINLKGVNVIRVFQRGGAPIVWGARTTTKNTNWQYVNIRRLFLFLEESIQVGIRGSVFEPNNLELWQKLKRTISAFLAQQWRDGALFGATEKDAFYVRIDEAINPPDQRALGRLSIEIGVKPSYPAEFIVVRIGIWEGGSEVTE